MDTLPRYCQKCGKPLTGEALFCGSCGQPVPGVSFFTPQEGAASEKPKTRRGVRFWFGLLSLIGGSLTSCGSLAAMAVFLLGGGQAASAAPTMSAYTETPILAAATRVTPPPPSAEMQLTLDAQMPVEVINTPIPEGIVTLTPTVLLPTPTTEPVSMENVQTGTYSEDFEDVESGWGRLNEDTYDLDYAPEGRYRIELKTPDKMVASEPPLPFESPFYDMLLSVRAKGEGGNGYYGLLCHYKDDNNYYRAGIANGYYTVSKLVNGSLSYLTDPPWKPILLYEPDDDGYVTISLACEDGRIQLLIDEVGQEIITDTDLNEGDAALFVSAGNQPDAEGVYMRGYFDDFSVELR